MVETELAWAAGFFDGEGTIYRVRPRVKSPSLMMHVTQTDSRPLERFMTAVGVGNVYGPYKHGGYKKSKSHWKDRWQWQTGKTDDMAHVIEVLWQHLSDPKREQIARVIDGYVHERGWSL